jgi:hypothetical protein
MTEINSSIDRMTKEILQKQEMPEVSEDFTLEVMKRILQENKNEVENIGVFQQFLIYLKEFQSMIILLFSLSIVFLIFNQNFKSAWQFLEGFMNYFTPLARYFNNPVVKITLISFIILCIADIIFRKLITHKNFI